MLQVPGVDASVDVPSADVDVEGSMPSVDVVVSAPSASVDLPGKPVSVFVAWTLSLEKR